MGNITNFFAPVSKNKDQPSKSRQRPPKVIEEDDEDDDFQQPPAKKRATEVNPSEYFSSKKATSASAAAVKPTKTKAAHPAKQPAAVKSEPAPMDIDDTPVKTTSRKRTKAKQIKDEQDDDFKPTHDNDDVAPEPADEKPAKKPSGRAAFFAMKNRATPQALGSRPRPNGQPGCLNNMAFVITGEFETLTRNEIEEIVKTYGGRTTGAVSGKTNFLLFGRGAGESKSAKAKKLGVKVLEEDGFYDLINNSKGQDLSVPEPPAASSAKPAKTTPAKAVSKAKASATAPPPPGGDAGELLWTEKYKPNSVAEIAGNKKLVKSVSDWLGAWDDNRKKGFHANAKDESLDAFRAVLLSGPPGVGKTTTAQLVAKEHGYEPLEFNASDVRNRKILKELLSEAVDNRSVTEFFSGSTQPKKAKHGRVVLIMDEVDGMSAGDRGGCVELAGLIKTSKIPVICICNDSRSDKIKPLLKVCYEFKYYRTPANQLRSHFMKICWKENLKVEPNAIDELVAITGNDIRQVINILSSYRLAHTDMKYADAKSFGSANQKYSQINLFEIPGKILSTHAWQRPVMSKLSEVYFHDYSLSPLMIFENYTKWNPSKADRWNKSGSPKERDCLEMDLIAKAADAMADGDLVDTRITYKQEFSLMPVQSIFSCVRPGYYMTGQTSGMNRVGFPLFLGQLSKENKYKRQLANIQTKLRTKGTPDEIRQHYVPALTNRIFNDITEGNIDAAMDTMDYYYLDKENLDTLNEVALGKPPMTKVPAADKRKFNAAYKKRSHPMLFQLSDTTPLKSKSKGAADVEEDKEGAIFDVEEAVDSDSDE
ncbi:DNA replication factor C, large subunit [Hesseltinella vesiculosa]|uniref:Replication factor C subunit 1 n=1 Tax=Hesseltinella vesiculosa TaxID=101127 RepID=A0A1X2GAD3_9FUNG|nr:DNA replication factor C, large subunit [Hesseltinella vesiculosa]